MGTILWQTILMVLMKTFVSSLFKGNFKAFLKIQQNLEIFYSISGSMVMILGKWL